MRNIKEFEGFNLNENFHKNQSDILIKKGLSEIEAKTFLELLGKIKLTEEDTNSFKKEMQQDIPFEGGMSFGEALIGLKINSL